VQNQVEWNCSNGEMKLLQDNLFRMREFEQMEMQFFVVQEMKHYEFWKEAIEMAFISRFRKENYRFHDHEN
jgi:glycyl-tRNA synthetase